MDFKGVENWVKFKSFNPYKLELTVFINVNIPILKEFSNLILNKVNKLTNINKDKIKIITVKKYLLISLESIFTFENSTLFRSICFGFAWDTNSFNENFVNIYIFKNLIPELVETKDPPIIIKIRKIKLSWLFTLNENPILDTLEINENKVIEKLLSWLKKIKKIPIKETK